MSDGLRLYHSPNSPFVRKVMICLHEVGLLDQVTLVPVSGGPIDPGTMPVGLNPLGKIPALERRDGPALYDSRVIVRYLDHLSGGKLLPAPPRLWDSLTLEASADGIADAAVLMAYEARLRPEEARYAPWVEAQWTKIARMLDVLEERWMAHLYGPFDAGHAALAAALGYVDLRHGARAWRAGRPALAAWEAKTAQRASVSATIPPG